MMNSNSLFFRRRVLFPNIGARRYAKGRYFYNVYGPGQIETGTYATVVGIFERLYREDKPLTVVYPGTQTRMFTHIDDVVDGILLVAERGSGDEYFLGTEEPTTIVDLALLFDHRYEYIDAREGERTHSMSKPSRARTELGWKPVRTLTNYVNLVVKK